MGKKDKYDPAAVYRRTVANRDESEGRLGMTRGSYFDTDYIASRGGGSGEVEDFSESEDQSVEAINRQIVNLERAVQVKCNHRDSRGKLKLKSSGDLYECDCGEKFDLSKISEARIDDAVEVMHNMINALRMLDSVGPLEKFGITDESLGIMNLDIKEVAKKYKKDFSK